MSESFDVIVCGGGTAGAAAAIAAARVGAKTLVIEQFGSLGGTQSNGWVTPQMPNHIGAHKLSRGLNLRILESQSRLQPNPGTVPHSDDWYDPALLPLVLDRLASEAGVRCLFNGTIVGAKVEDGRVRSVLVQHRGAPVSLAGGVRLACTEIEGRFFVDTTGDAEFSRLAGAAILSGNEEGVHQPMTLRFSMGGFDMARLRESLKPHLRCDQPPYMEFGYGDARKGSMAPWVEQAIAEGILQEDDLGYFQGFTVNGRPGEMAFNAPRVAGLDPMDPWQLSLAYQLGREKVWRIANFVRRFFGGAENAYISVIAPLIGIRETQRAVGEYVLTEEDHQSCRKFPNPIARNRYPVDIHLKVGTDYRRFPDGEWHDIPYECLVVKGFENLFVAGRCLSATFVAQSAVRIQPVCRATGEAAGAAAALCAQLGCRAKDLPYSSLEPFLDLETIDSATSSSSIR
jgi:ribulose 1,5-bisphosphate synthetase/thiazole synthase